MALCCAMVTRDQNAYLAVFDVVELLGKVSGPRDELSRKERPLTDPQRRSSDEALSRLMQERNLSHIDKSHDVPALHVSTPQKQLK